MTNDEINREIHSEIERNCVCEDIKIEDILNYESEDIRIIKHLYVRPYLPKSIRNRYEKWKKWR